MASASHDSAPTEEKIRMGLGLGGALGLWRGALVPGWDPESISGVQGDGAQMGIRVPGPPCSTGEDSPAWGL